MEGYILQWMDGQTTVEGIDGGLHPAVDGWTDYSGGH